MPNTGCYVVNYIHNKSVLINLLEDLLSGPMNNIFKVPLLIRHNTRHCSAEYQHLTEGQRVGSYSETNANK